MQPSCKLVQIEEGCTPVALPDHASTSDRPRKLAWTWLRLWDTKAHYWMCCQHWGGRGFSSIDPMRLPGSIAGGQPGDEAGCMSGLPCNIFKVFGRLLILCQHSRINTIGVTVRANVSMHAHMHDPKKSRTRHSCLAKQTDAKLSLHTRLSHR